MGNRQAQGKPNHWLDLRNEIIDRTKEPFGHPSFFIFFIVAVFGASAAGVWLEVIRYFMSDPRIPVDAILTAILTFFPALAAINCMQMILAEKIRSFRAFTIVIFIICILGWILCAFSTIEKSTAICWGAFFSAISLWMWCITNAKQPDFRDDINTSAPIGGDNLDVTLSGDGDLNEFKH